MGPRDRTGQDRPDQVNTTQPLKLRPRQAKLGRVHVRVRVFA